MALFVLDEFLSSFGGGRIKLATVSGVHVHACLPACLPACSLCVCMSALGLKRSSLAVSPCSRVGRCYIVPPVALLCQAVHDQSTAMCDRQQTHAAVGFGCFMPLYGE
jgi:hypothetical protein